LKDIPFYIQSKKKQMKQSITKPTLVMDVDGVIFNFCKPFATWWNRHHSSALGHVCPENPKAWNMEYVDKKNPARSNEVINEKILEFLATKPMFPLMEENIVDTIKMLRCVYRIHIVTAFPEAFKTLREANFRVFGIEYDDITYVEGHKLATILEINPVAVVEDSPVHIRDIAGAGYKVFVPIYWQYTHPLYQDRVENARFYLDAKDLEFKLRLHAPPPRKPFFPKKVYEKV
jgi:hypothetical protein